MIGFETYWAYKHAWRGAGYYYRKGDHIPPTKGGDVSLAKALSIVAAWETWYLPRPQPVDPVLVTSPDAWVQMESHLERIEARPRIMGPEPHLCQENMLQVLIPMQIGELKRH